jgi:hypothetical protein
MLVWGACALAALSFLSNISSALDISGTLFVGIDQVRINAVLKRTANGSPLIADFGEGVTSINIQGYLDTGASGVLISDQTAGYLGLKKARFPEPGGPLVTYSDVGVGGVEVFNVSEPVYIGLGSFLETGDTENPAYYTQTLGPIRTQISMPALDPQLEGLDVIGMPAMAGKVVVIDPRPADPSNPNLGTMNTFIYNPGTPFNPNAIGTNPGIPQTSLSVKLSYSNFSRFTEVGPVGAEGPSLRSNPFIGPNPVLALDPNPPVDNTPGVQMTFNGLSTGGSMLLDTGAIASMVSKNKAAALGVRYVLGTEGTATPKLEKFDINNPGNPGTLIPAADQFSIPIGGIGGTKTISGFYLDTYTIPTEQGNGLDFSDPNHLHYLGAPVLVNDISVEDPVTHQQLTLDGILGTNYLTGSAEFFSTFPFFGGLQDGAFNWVVFDEPNGLLKLAPKVAVIPEPATCVLGGFAIAGIAWMARRRRARQNTQV